MDLRFISIVFIGLTLGLGFGVEQSDFFPIIGQYTLFFAAYIFVFLKVNQESQVRWFLYTAVLLRVILIFAFPNLSDDIYRFVWDGRLLIQGINPFDHLPSHYIQQGNEVPGLEKALYEELNSPEYFTIYPPVCQAVFASACWLFPESLIVSSLFMKCIIVVLEIGTLFILYSLLKEFSSKNSFVQPKNVLLYALNPLILLEISGNLHFEGPMVFFLVLALWLLIKKRETLSAISFALSIAAKLLPLMFLPLLIVRLGWKKAIRYFLIVGFALLLFFSPLINGVFIQNFGDSLNLYFQKFEFNASIYYFLRWLGFQIKGYNLIGILGPLLASLVLLGILIRTFKEKNPTLSNLPLAMLFAITLYLLLTTTIHPWYLSLPIVLCTFTRFKFPILWSFLIFWTYINYSYESYSENLWVVAAEYITVLSFLFWELTKSTKFYDYKTSEVE